MSMNVILNDIRHIVIQRKFMIKTLHKIKIDDFHIPITKAFNSNTQSQ